MDEQTQPVSQAGNPSWINYLKILAVISVLYLFLVSIGLIGASFKDLGLEFAQALLQSSAGPIIGLFIGILATSVIQSSSTTTSLVVGMVAAGTFGSDPYVAVANTVPIIMGANIGTSITNTIVSLGHVVHKAEFQRAFSASVIHDFFNILAVLFLLPLEELFGIISRSANWMATLFIGAESLTFRSPIKMITTPVVDWMYSLCQSQPVIHANWLALLLALILLFFSLRNLTRLIRSLVISRLEVFFDTHIFKTWLRAMAFGVFITVLVQSSSITTSLVIPLAGAGILRLEQIFPYTLGSNIGTTLTALLASLVTGAHAPLAVAFSHLLFNIFGIIGIWSIPPIRRIPITLARGLAGLTMKSRILPLVYIIVVFFVMPISLIILLR